MITVIQRSTRDLVTVAATGSAGGGVAPAFEARGLG